MTLKPFDDHDVTECAIRVVRAGDGLSEALEAEPVELELGEVVVVLLRGEVTKITYEEIRDSDELRRVHTVRASSGRLLDAAAAGELLEASRRAIEEARGIARLPLDEAEP